MKGRGIYLQEGDVYVGPFAARKDARRFLMLMELLGESLEGIRIVEADSPPKPVIDGDNRGDSTGFPDLKRFVYVHRRRKEG